MSLSFPQLDCETCDIYNPAKKITVVLNIFLQQHTQITENQDKMSVDIFF